MATIRKTLIAILLVLVSVSAQAAGLGKLTSFSALGQPFRAEIELVSVTKEESLTLSARLAPPTAFEQANIEYASSLLGIKFSVDKGADGQQVLRLSSTQPINEPFLDMLVELDWAGGRLVREYNLLLDPPGYTGTTPAAPAASVPAPVQLPTTAPPPETTPMPAATPVESHPLPETPAPAATETPAPAATETPPPAEAKPAPEAKPLAAPQPKKANATYEVKHGDTLRKIAEQNQIDGVSVDQMLIALYRANHAAFIDNNMNRMRSGVILTIPDRETALATGEPDARRLVTAQASDFNAYRRRLAGLAEQAPPAKTAAPAQSAQGKIAPQITDKSAATKPGQDTLKLSQADQAGKGAAGAKSAAAAKADDKAARDKAVEESKQRVAALEKNAADMKKLLELKNQQAAEMQAKAAQDKAAQDKAAQDKALLAKAAEDKAAQDKAAQDKAAQEKAAAKAVPPPVVATNTPAPAPAATTPAPAATTAEAPAATPAATPAEPKAEPKAVAKPAAKKAAPPESGLVDTIINTVTDNIMYVGGGLAVVVAAIVAFALRRRKGISKFEDSIITGGDLKANSVFANTGGQSVDTGGSSLQSIVSESDSSGSDSDEVDPIAEADVYMAYGRDSQAEEILKEALAKDPGRQAIRSKLLEIYFTRKDARTFETIAGELYAATGGSGPEWTKAVEMGAQLDPNNSLYGGQAPRLPASAPTPAPAPSPEDTVIIPGAIGGQMQTDTMILPPKAGAAHPPAEEPAPAAEEIIDLSAPVDTPAMSAPEPAPVGDLDFDLDLGDSAPKTAAAHAAPSPTETGGLDFDIGGDSAAPSVESSAIDFQAPAGAESEFDSTSTVAMAEAQAQATVAGAVAKMEAEAAATQKIEVEAPPKLPDDMIMLDQSGDEDHEKTIVVDFNMLDEPSGSAPAGGNGAAGGVMDARWQEVATKLDLAKAYEEMGDKDGTRELLNEVLKEGDNAQQDQARSILARLG